MTLAMEALHQWVGWGVRIESGGARLEAEVTRPAGARGLVIFAQSGVSLLSRRNRRVADLFHGQGLATLVFNFLTPEEAEEDAEHGEFRSDVELLSRRLLGATRWAAQCGEVSDLPIAFFGGNAGTAAALTVAAESGRAVRAIVSQSGRPELAEPSLPRVQSPTLLIVGGGDPEGAALNRAAYRMLSCEKALRIVPGAGPLLEEPGAMEEMGEFAAAWFLFHFS